MRCIMRYKSVTAIVDPAPDEQRQAKNGMQKDAQKEDGSFVMFVVKLALIVLIFRSFIFSPFSIPSESMLPRLMNGDYLLAAKWPYGISKYSLPGEVPIIPGRIFASAPEPGDIVIFKHPIDGVDYIKRAIALPGDTVEVADGTLILNGAVIPRRRIADIDVPLSPNTSCHPLAQLVELGEDALACRYPRYRETLPSGRAYDIIDLGRSDADDFGPVIVPEGRMFVMGDNRDNSQDSRFPAEANGGVGMVPMDLLVGRATVLMWSTDGGAEWIKPWTWFTAARGSRIGDVL